MRRPGALLILTGEHWVSWTGQSCYLERLYALLGGIQQKVGKRDKRKEGCLMIGIPSIAIP